jgi:hypothetical protein
MLYSQRNIFRIITIIMVVLICQSSIIETRKSQKGQIKLIVRADDIASFHAANLACIKTFREGVARSVEIMVPCAWFPEAVKILNENPGFDVGVHLVLTSEWDNIKWRPLTHVPSLVDKDGYFYPNIWGDAKKSPDNFLLGADWKIEEIEQELRAQIELVKKYLPQISHLTGHMGLTDMHKDVKALVQKLAKEYNLGSEDDFALKHMQGFGGYADSRVSSGATPGALNLAMDIYSGLNYGNMQAWVWWQGSEAGGISNYSLMTNNTAGKKYYVSKHYYRYIRPGAVRVKSASDDPDIFVTAFEHQAKGTNTIVIINAGSEARSVSVQGDDLPAAFTIYQTTSGSDNCKEAGTINQGPDNHFELPAKSIVILQAGGNPL